MIELIYLGGIPHWRNGGVTLPIMAGGQEELPAWLNNYLNPEEEETRPTLIGADLYNQDGTYAGQLVQRPSGRLFLAIESGGTTQMHEFTGGSYLTSFNEGVTLSPAGELLSSRDIPFPSAPSGGGAGRTQFPSERAADEARAALDLAQARNIQTVAERAADREAQERIARLRDLNDLIQQAMGNQQSAREMKFGLRSDPFALAGAFGPGLRGTTPTQAFSAELGNYANAPLPSVPQNASLAQINQGIQQVQGLGAVPTGGGFGMAQGGSMGAAGPDFSPPGYSVIVGEGALNGDEEVVTRLNDGTVLVTPLKGGAQTGATLTPTTPTAPSSFAPLSGLYGGFGFENFPRYHISPTGYNLRGATAEQFGRLGYRPSLIESGGDYYYNENGVLKKFANRAFSGSGFNVADALSVAPGELGKYGTIGGVQRTPLPEISPAQGNFGPAGVPLISQYNQILPNPFYIGAELRDAALNDPVAWANYTSAYANARGPGGEALGISPEQLLAMAEAPFPQGVPRTLLGFR